MENRRRRKVKKQPAGTSVIVREQIQLLKAEKEIQEALKQIGQYRNRLIVSISPKIVDVLAFSAMVISKKWILSYRLRSLS